MSVPAASTSAASPSAASPSAPLRVFVRIRPPLPREPPLREPALLVSASADGRPAVSVIRPSRSVADPAAAAEPTADVFSARPETRIRLPGIKLAPACNRLAGSRQPAGAVNINSRRGLSSTPLGSCGKTKEIFLDPPGRSAPLHRPSLPEASATAAADPLSRPSRRQATARRRTGRRAAGCTARRCLRGHVADMSCGGSDGRRGGGHRSAHRSSGSTPRST